MKSREAKEVTDNAPALDKWASWLLYRRYGENQHARAAMSRLLQPIRDKVLDHARIDAGHTVLDIGSGDGFLAFGAMQRVGPSGTVIFSDISEDLLELSKAAIEGLAVRSHCRFVQAPAEDLGAIASDSCHAVTLRCVLIYVAQKHRALQEIYRVLKPGGSFSICEPVTSMMRNRNDRCFFGYDVSGVESLAFRVLKVYQERQGGADNPMSDFDHNTLLHCAEEAGFSNVNLELRVISSSNPPAKQWEEFIAVSPNPLVPSLREAMDVALIGPERERFVSYLRPLVESGLGVPVRTAHVYLWGTK